MARAHAGSREGPKAVSRDYVYSADRMHGWEVNPDDDVTERAIARARAILEALKL